MAQPPVDYDALAKKYGGRVRPPRERDNVDYDSLAQEVGGHSIDGDARSEAPAAERDETDWVKTATGFLPTVGGIAGGLIGGIGGTAFGMGVGGVPGAIGGATLGGATGEAGRQLINRALGYSAPETAEEAASDIGTEGAIQGAAEATGAALVKGVGAGARAVYRGYLKPSLSASNLARASKTTEAAMDEGLAVSEAGKQKGLNLIRELKSEVDNLLQKNTSGFVDVKAVADRVRQFAKDKYYKPGADMSDFTAAMSVADRIDAHPSLGIARGIQPRSIRVKLVNANEIKRALDDAVGDAQFGVTSTAKTSAEKTGRHEVNQAMQRQGTGEPAIGPLNRRESRLIDATKAIAQAVEREANQNPLYGWKTLASTGLGLGAAGTGTDPETAAVMALVARGALRPAVATRAAIIARRAAKQFGIPAVSAARLAVAAVSQEE